MRILITGATGFIGNAVFKTATQRALYTRPVFRNSRLGDRFGDLGITAMSVPTLDINTDWSRALADIDVVIHCAARVHVVNKDPVDSLIEYRKINVDGTLNLAKQAAFVGVKRFIFISSIGVNGAETFGAPFNEQDIPIPHSPYAASKYEAELGLEVLAAQTGMEIVIIRPPLVYGPYSPGSFGWLILWLQRCIPLPLGAIHNKRSFVALDNLVDLILDCVSHPSAANQTFLVSDGEDVSTTDLLRRMGCIMGRPAYLLPMPAMLLKAGFALVGKSGLGQSLCGSLQVDINKARKLLDWSPPIAMDEGLRRALEGRG